MFNDNQYLVLDSIDRNISNVPTVANDNRHLLVGSDNNVRGNDLLVAVHGQFSAGKIHTHPQTICSLAYLCAAVALLIYAPH